MKMQSPRLVSASDVTEAPSWLKKVLPPITTSLELLFGCVQRGFSIVDNANAEVRVLKVRDNEEFYVALKSLAGLPTHVVVSQVINPPDFCDLKWMISPESPRTIICVCKFHSAPVGDVTIRLRIEGD